MLIGYARLSTECQNLDRQIDMLVDYGVDKRNIYQEKITGTRSDRTQLNKMIEELQENDIVIICDLIRISRSTKDLLNIIDRIKAKEGLKSAKARGRNGGRPSKRNDKADTVALLYREGYKIVDIVKQTGLSRATIYRTLKDLGLID